MAPSDAAPSMKASLSGLPDSRMSRATTSRGARVNRAKADPTARQTSVSSWSGTLPRTS